jgi:hypothetical protein
MMRAVVLIASIGLIGVVTLVGVGSRTAQGGGDEVAQVDLPHVVPPTMFDPPTPAEMRDLETVAQQRGISIEQAVATRGWRRGFSQLVQEVQARHPDSFAGAAIEQDGSIWIGFTGAVPAEIEPLVTHFEREVLERHGSSARIQLLPDRDIQEREIASALRDDQLRANAQ